MELRVLKYFVTIVQERNISNAANVLHISQSTLSRQIKELEEELETTLFIRGKQTITLTQDGQYLYSRACEILQIANDAKTVIKADELIIGSLHIGVGENYMGKLVAEVFAQIIRQYPDVKVNIHNIASDLIPGEINRGVLDFGFVFNQHNLNNFYQLPFNYKDQWGVLLPKKHHLAKLSQITPQDLIGERIVIGRQNSLIENWHRWLSIDSNKVHQVGTYDMSESMNLLVESGVGLAITFDKPEYHLNESKLKFLPLVNFISASPKMIWKKERPLSNLDKLFLKKMKKQAKRLQN